MAHKISAAASVGTSVDRLGIMAQLIEANAKVPPDQKAALQEICEELVSSEQVTAQEQAELLATQRELEILRQRYTNLYDFAPIGYATLDRDGHVQDINLRGAEMLRLDRKQIIESPLIILLASEDREKFLRTLRRLMRSENQPVSIFVHFESEEGTSPLLQLQIARAVVDDPASCFRVAILDVTAEHRAEEAVRRNEARFRALIENANETITIVNRAGKITFESANVTAILGYRAQDLLGMDGFALIHPDDVPKGRRLFAEALATPNVTHQLEVRVQHRNGTWRWMQITGKNLLANPSVAGLVINARDITTRKEAEAELATAKQRLDAHMENSPLAVIEFDPRFRVIRWSREAERMFGWSAVEVTGRAIGELRWVYEEDKKAVQQVAEDMLSGRLPCNLHINRNYHKDGRILVCEWYNSAIYDSQGRLTSILSQVLDVTSRKQADAALRHSRDQLEERVRERTLELIQSNTALRESEARLQAIMDNSPSMMFLKDPRGRYLHFNRKFADTFHVTIGETPGKTDAQIFPRHEAAAFRANDRKVLKAGVPMQFDEVSRQEDGLHTSIVTKFPLRDAKGKIYAIAGIVTDITERKRLEAEVLHATEREQRRIAQDLHDGLGQQLTGIQFMSHALQERLAEKSMAEEAAAAQIAELVRLATSQAHDLAKGLSPVEPKPEALNPALRRLTTGIAKLFGVACELSSEQHVMIRNPAIANHLYRIAQEAISNAVRHGGATQITVQLRKKHGRISLVVNDNGRGFSPLKQKKKGMGLNIMHHRAAVAGGSLVVRRRRAGGMAVICQLEKETSR